MHNISEEKETMAKSKDYAKSGLKALVNCSLLSAFCVEEKPSKTAMVQSNGPLKLWMWHYDALSPVLPTPIIVIKN